MPLRRFFALHWPLILAALTLGAALAVSLRASLRLTDGHLVYALDDAYIHMAIARNLAEHATWGVNAGEFSSSSSSIAWPALVALGYLPFGVNEVVPFVLASLFALGLLLAIHAAFLKAEAPAWLEAVVLIATIFFTPLPTLIFTGLEHTLHALVIFLFLAASARVLADRAAVSRRALLAVSLLSAAVTSARYEGLFAVAAVAFCALILRRLAFSFVVLTSGVAPAILYGVISISMGWMFFPNSVVLKSRLLGIPNSPTRPWLPLSHGFFESLYSNPDLGFVLLAAFVGCVAMALGRLRQRPSPPMILLILLSGVLILHVGAARIGYFYRYEAYLIAAAVPSFGLMLAESLRVNDAPQARARVRLTVLACLLPLLPWLNRSSQAILFIPLASKNVYEQHYQMGLFLRRYYPGVGVAANDIGAVAFLSESPVLDVLGLADAPLAIAQMNHALGPAAIEEGSRRRNVKVAALYTSWFPPAAVPRGWIRCEEWTIRQRIVAGANAVSWYATDAHEAGLLRDRLREYQSRLPADVLVRTF